MYRVWYVNCNISICIDVKFCRHSTNTKMCRVFWLKQLFLIKREVNWQELKFHLNIQILFKIISINLWHILYKCEWFNTYGLFQLVLTMIPPFCFLWIFVTSLYIKSIIRRPLLKKFKSIIHTTGMTIFVPFLYNYWA